MSEHNRAPSCETREHGNAVVFRPRHELQLKLPDSSLTG
ncbi:uncharacterized protein ANIA_11613 [Aspergillus nidulans FGSC A4]|uniref:Uncharacterized protein n=1 Tax=Emericella nidulans (strain FGSC A4 / ATCC 38163 / CBS 112.46 / NRRL 194 / M139) TaxID=227321 RepID=C8VEE4_EMENI|nr:hypothetical protein [Aspergillus nidulans FGSC A4]CBF80546.1 TPA: hypothetical protein ANIA_11613 [Aspergillus nidulans FGSC A4]